MLHSESRSESVPFTASVSTSSSLSPPLYHLRDKKTNRRNSLSRILMPIHPRQPFLIIKIMHPRPLRHHARQLSLVRMRDPHSIIPARAQPPDHDLVHVKHPQLIVIFTSNSVLVHPHQQTRPQPVGALRVRRVGRTIGRSGNLDHHDGPSSTQKLVAPHRVVGPVPVETRHEDDHGHAGAVAESF